MIDGRLVQLRDSDDWVSACLGTAFLSRTTERPSIESGSYGAPCTPKGLDITFLGRQTTVIRVAESFTTTGHYSLGLRRAGRQSLCPTLANGGGHWNGLWDVEAMPFEPSDRMERFRVCGNFMNDSQGCYLRDSLADNTTGIPIPSWWRWRIVQGRGEMNVVVQRRWWDSFAKNIDYSGKLGKLSGGDGQNCCCLAIG